MPYHVGAKGSYGCSGYPAVKDDGTVMGCHQTRSQASAQIYAINQSEGNIDKAMPDLKEGDWAVTGHGKDEFHIGQVIHVMRDGALGVPGAEYYMEATAENPAVMIQLYEQDDEGWWEATRLYTACMMSMMIPIDPLPVEPKLTDVEMSMDNSMYAAKSINKSMYRVVQNNPGCSEGFAVVDEDGELEGCFATREEATIFAEANNKEEQMEDMDDMMEMGKARTMANAPYQDAQMDSENSAEMEMAAKPNYGEMIQPRRGGSTPSNPRLYARIVQEAKDKFDVYPSAVANGWVVQEYKRRGGTYKSETTKGMGQWSGSIFDLNPFVK